MSKVNANISISLDGFGAGPNQSPENPLGEGGERLHDWVVATRGWRAQHGLEGGTDGADSDIAERFSSGVGAFIMGRRAAVGRRRRPGARADRGRRLAGSHARHLSRGALIARGGTGDDCTIDVVVWP